MKLFSSSPEGSSLSASRPSVKSIWTLCDAFFEAAPHLVFMFVQEIVDEFLPRVTGNRFRRIHEAQRRRRNDRLLQGHVRIAPGDVDKTVRAHQITKRPSRQPRPLARVMRRKEA